MSPIYLRPIFLIGIVLDLAVLAVLIWLMASGYRTDIWLIALIAFFLCTIALAAYVRYHRPQVADVEGRGGIRMNRLRAYYHRNDSSDSDSSDGIDRSSMRSVEDSYTAPPGSVTRGLPRGTPSISGSTLNGSARNSPRNSFGSSRFSSASTLVPPQNTHARAIRVYDGPSSASSTTSLPALPRTPIIRPQAAYTRPGTPLFR